LLSTLSRLLSRFSLGVRRTDPYEVGSAAFFSSFLGTSSSLLLDVEESDLVCFLLEGM